MLRRLVYRAHFVLACLVGGSFFLLLSAAGLVYAAGSRRMARRAPYLFARAFSGVMSAILGWKVQAEGLEHLAAAHPAILVANHQSNLDIVTYGAAYPRDTVLVAKKEIVRIPGFGWFLTATGNILIDRANAESAQRSMAEAAERIRRERVSVWMFPEGHRNQRSELLPFKKGSFRLAIAAQVPVVIIVSEPIDTLLDASRWMVRPGRFRIRMLPSIPTTGMTPEDVDQLLETTRAKVQAARVELAASARERIG